MKKILALLMAITLLFSLCACNQDTEGVSSNEPDVSSSDDFVKPENYAAVIGLTINPEFEIYIDGDENLLALNAVNDDAKAIENDIDLSKKDIGSVVSAIVKKAYEAGYMQSGGSMTLKAIEVLDSALNIGDTVKKASDAAETAINELNIDFKVNPEEDNAEDTTSETSSNQDTSFEEETSLENETSKIEPEEPTESKPEEPTESKPEGTVSEENKPETSKPEESEPEEITPSEPTTLNPKTNIEMDETKEYIGNKYSPYDENTVEAHGVSFTEECIILLSPVFVTEDSGDEIPEGRAPIIYNNKEYYRIGAGQTPHYYEITDTEIILKNSFWEEEEKTCAKMVLLSDGTLKVTYSSIDKFAVGDILSLEWSYLS